MRKVYVPFSMASRCAVTNFYSTPGFHTCDVAPSFADDAKLVVFTSEDFDRWKGLISVSLQRALSLAAAWLRQSAGGAAPQTVRAA